jgi:predicted protein tyrosine phosphatase
MRRVLFVDGAGRALAPTAAQVFAERADLATDFAGIDADAGDPVSAEQIEWADVVVAMENRHRVRLSERFRARLRGRAVVVLGVPDTYPFMDPRLVALLRERAGEELDR